METIPRQAELILHALERAARRHPQEPQLCALDPRPCKWDEAECAFSLGVIFYPRRRGTLKGPVEMGYYTTGDPGYRALENREEALRFLEALVGDGTCALPEEPALPSQWPLRPRLYR